MEICLKHGEDIEEGWKRIIRDRCTSAVRELRKNSNHRTAIHESRKSLKKVRAALRLVRPGIDFYKRENIFFRDLGRQLAPLRDATAKLETVDIVRSQFASKFDGKIFDTLTEQLEENRRQLEGEVLAESDLMKSVADQLEVKSREIKSWDFETSDFEPMKSGIRKVYKRGKKAYLLANQEQDAFLFHEWRKRVKYLRYQLRIIFVSWPTYFKSLEKEYHRLTNILGSAHDLSVLLESIQEESISIESSDEKESLLGMLREHRLQLRDHAILLGSKLYAREPDHISNNLEQYWASYKNELDKTSTLIPINDLEY